MSDWVRELEPVRDDGVCWLLPGRGRGCLSGQMVITCTYASVKHLVFLELRQPWHSANKH
jgi:hypothetical protein